MTERKTRELLGGFPDDWQIEPLPTLAYFQEGPGITSDKFRESGTPFLNIRCIEDGYINREMCQCVSTSLASGAYKHFLLDEGDWVFSSSGTIGKIAMIRSQDLPLLLNTSTIRFRSRDESIITREYIRVFLESEHFRRQHSHQTQGSAQVNVGPTHLRLMFVPRPSCGEQRKIAQILTTVDDLIEKTKALIAKFQTIKQGMMHDLFTRGVNENGQLRPVYEEAPELYKQSKLGWIPKEWDLCLLDDVAARGSGHTPNKEIASYWNGGIKWISLADSDKLDRLYITTTDKEISERGLANSSAVKHRPGTVILSRDAGIGKSAILTQVMAVSQHFIAWWCGERLVNFYLYYWLQHEKSRFEAIAMGSTIKTIGLPFFKKLRIAVPPRSEQQVGSDALLSIERVLFRLDQERGKLRMLKAGLMQDLLTGKVRAKVDEEESANV